MMDYSSSFPGNELDGAADNPARFDSYEPAPLIVGLKSPIGRPLGTLERLFWIIDRARPIHFTITAHVTGPTTPAQWRDALDRVQSRHPLLSVCIEQGPGGALRFRPVSRSPIPLRVVPGIPHDCWKDHVGEELSESFDWRQAPLLRARLILAQEEAALILTSHHSIADGLSIVYVIRDILRAMNGEALSPLPFPPSQEMLLGISPPPAGEEGPTREPVPEADSSPRVHPEPIVRSLRLPSRLTLQLKARAQAEGSSLHGALCAALVMAGRTTIGNWQGRPIRVFSPFEMRSLLDRGDACADYIFRGRTLFPENSNHFWALARVSKRDIAGQKTYEYAAESLSEFERLLGNQTEPETVIPTFAPLFAREVLLSNLGAMPFPSEFGALKLEAVWGPMLGPAFEGDLVLGAATVDNALHLTLTGGSPPQEFLEAMRNALVAACYI